MVKHDLNVYALEKLILIEGEDNNRTVFEKFEAFVEAGPEIKPEIKIKSRLVFYDVPVTLEPDNG